MMKRAAVLFLTLIMALSLAGAAAEQLKIEGKVEAAATHSILAPYTGDVLDFTARAGDFAEAGEALFALRAEPVYADFDGVITGVFAEAGDSAESVMQRYDALCYIERASLYAADCTTSGADGDENKTIHVGETVFVRSRDNDSRKGVAVVTGVSGSSYKLEILDHGKLRRSDGIKVYRESDFSSSSCIGMGALRRIEPVAVTGEGWVRSAYVTNGQQVRRGDLLFELVPDALEGMQGSDGMVTMPQDGVLLSISAQSGTQAQKNAVLATYCTKDELRVICPVYEDDLVDLRAGMEIEATIDGCGERRFSGVVEKIAEAGSDDGSGMKFDVVIRLNALDGVRIGMTATVRN